MRAGDKGRRMTKPDRVTRAGTFTFPALRRADDSSAVIQIEIEPANTMPNR